MKSIPFKPFNEPSWSFWAKAYERYPDLFNEQKESAVADARATPRDPMFKKVAEFDLGGKKFTEVEVDFGEAKAAATRNAYFDAVKANFNAQRKAAAEKPSYDRITPEQWKRGILETDRAFALQSAMSAPAELRSVDRLMVSPPDVMLIP